MPRIFDNPAQLTTSLHLNPVRYLPRYEQSRRDALEMGERDGWTVEHLGQVAQVFNGPRCKRPTPITA